MIKNPQCDSAENSYVDIPCNDNEKHRNPIQRHDSNKYCRDMVRYEDMLDLPHPVSSTHPQMPLANRAAQFSPFAALTGYDGQITEAARLTTEKIELSEEEKSRLDEKLQMIQEHIATQSQESCTENAAGLVSITCFHQDTHKTGGKYVTISGTVKRIDAYQREVVFFAENGISDGDSVAINDILDIDLVQINHI